MTGRFESGLSRQSTAPGTDNKKKFTQKHDKPKVL